MQCPYCKKIVNDNAVRCEYCGADLAGQLRLEDFLADSKPADADQLLLDSFLTDGEQTNVEPKSNKIKICIIVLLLVLTTIAAGYIWIESKMRVTHNYSQRSQAQEVSQLRDYNQTPAGPKNQMQTANLLSQAQILRDSGQLNDALACVSQVLNLNNQNSEAKQLKLELETLIGQKRVKAEKEEKFVAYCKTASAYEAKEEYDKAIEAYTNALSINPDDKEIQDKRAGCQRKAEYGKLLKQAQNAETENNLSEALRFYTKAQGYTEESLKDKIDSLNRQIAEKEKETKFTALLNRVRTLKGKEALILIEQALQIYPNNAEALLLKKKIESVDDKTSDINIPKPGYSQADSEKTRKEIDGLLKGGNFNEAIKKIRSELMPAYEKQGELCQWKDVGEYVLSCGKNYPGLRTAGALQLDDLHKTITKRAEEQVTWRETHEKLQTMSDNNSPGIVEKKLQILDSYISNNYLSFFRPIAEKHQAELRDRLAVLRAKEK
jgi:tetratricopeptide (TPR) repeat protein